MENTVTPHVAERSREIRKQIEKILGGRCNSDEIRDVESVIANELAIYDSALTTALNEVKRSHQVILECSRSLND